MLSKIFAPFTTPTAAGTVFRDLMVAAGAIITLLGLLGILTPEQVEALRKTVEQLSAQWPQIVVAAGVLITAGTSIYRAIFMSSSDVAAAAAKAIDKAGLADTGVTIKTPPGVADIYIASDGKTLGS